MARPCHAVVIVCMAPVVATAKQLQAPAPVLATSTRRALLAAVPSAASVAAALAARHTATATGAVHLADAGVWQAHFAAEARQAAALAEKVAADYSRDGVAVVRGAVSPAWVDLLRGACEAAQDDPGPGGQYLGPATDAGTFFTDLEMARRIPAFAAFALHGPCAAIAGTVTGAAEVRYLYDQLFIKETGVSLPTPWHQDGGYWRARGDDLASVFVPLDPVPSHECLAFMAGTHTWPLHNPAHFADGTSYTGTGLPELPDVEGMAARGLLTALRFDLRPGDALVFSAATVHGGRGNWGRALSTRWAGNRSRFWPRPGEGAVPTGDLGLGDGAPLRRNSRAFPLAWRAGAATDRARG